MWVNVTCYSCGRAWVEEEEDAEQNQEGCPRCGSDSWAITSAYDPDAPDADNEPIPCGAYD